MRHHALREQRIKRLFRTLWQMSANMHRPRKEARIEQVQDRVLHTANILVHIHPILGIRRICRRLGAWRGEARKIPR